MKVLITGGYGFIGSHVAERFYKEGYEIFILDDLSSGSESNVKCKHKNYRLSIEDAKCEEVFRANRFDAVVHLAAQANVKTSLENPRLDVKSNVQGLVNMLTLAQKYGAKKFIFASSAAVYGRNEHLPLSESERCDPVSPYGISKQVGEMYCEKWQEIYGLETICFRFSNVYGPRQGGSGEGGVVSIFLERMLAGQELLVYGDGGQSRDFIFVEDVADAIYRSSYSHLTGIYNLSTNTESTIQQLLDSLARMHSITGVQYKERRAGDIHRSVLDNSRIMRDLDWVPLYSFAEGLRRTFIWFSQERPQRRIAPVAVKRPSAIHKMAKIFLPFVENALAFSMTAWFSLLQQDISYSVFDVKIFYIIIMAVIYGNRQSIIAVALSVGLFVYQKLNAGRELISLLYDTDFFFQIAIYLLVGLIVGYTIERKTALSQSQAREIEALEEKYNFLSEVYQEAREVKEDLQQQILNSEDSFGKIYNITKELESLEPEKIFTAAISVVESIMKTKSVSIYIVNPNGSYLRLVAHSHKVKAMSNKSLSVEAHDYLRSMFLNGKPFINKKLYDDAPLLAAPISHQGQFIAVVSVHEMPFEYFTLAYQNLFKVTIDLISSALSRAFVYIKSTESKRYIAGTPIVTKEVFDSILESKKAAKEKHDIDYLLLRGSCGLMPIEQFSRKLGALLRDTDYIGLDNNNDFIILLSATNGREAPLIIQRFAEKGIQLRLAEEETSQWLSG